MKTIYDKIYIVNFINNNNRRNFIKYQLDLLELEYEFIYTPDFYNLFKNCSNYEDGLDIYECMGRRMNWGMIGCELGHYMAVKQAYELGYNNVLMIEDDTCFIKDNNLIEYYLNNIPEDADMIRYSYGCIDIHDFNFVEHVHRNTNRNYLYYGGELPIGTHYSGTGMWAINNRETMKKYIDSVANKFICSDQVDLFFMNAIANDFNIYFANKCLCVDFTYYTYMDNPDDIPIPYKKLFLNSSNIDNFYRPDTLDESFTIM